MRASASSALLLGTVALGIVVGAGNREGGREREREQRSATARVATEEGTCGKRRQGGRGQKQEESIGGRKGGKEDRGKDERQEETKRDTKCRVGYEGARETWRYSV